MGRKKVVLIPPPHQRIIVDDPNSLGPLPENGVSFLSQMGAFKISVVVKDGRSWIITGLNAWRGQIRPFIARVFENGYVRDYMAIPEGSIDQIYESLKRIVDQSRDLLGGGNEEEES